MLSVIIPARNEKYLEKTIRNVLENATGDIEVIVILDGYLPDPQIHLNDSRVYFIHNPESRGQRQSINQGVEFCHGEYIMKLDAHCAVAKGFDEILVRDCEYDMTMIPTMYNLDVTNWKPKLHKKTDYMYISSPDDEKPFRAMYYGSKAPNNDKMIDDIMCCMGPCFFMHKQRFWDLEGCDEGHGSWGQQGIEVACKAWLSGGRLVVNKNTWFAHWFRGGGVPEGEKSGFPYELKESQVEIARKRSRQLWLDNKFNKQVRPFQWMIDKFNPPGWEKKMILELGSGTMPKVEGVINVDIRKLPNVDIVADLRRLPLDDNSVDEIRNADVIEHFGRLEVDGLLKEWSRVLKPGGIMKVRTVDMERTMDKWRTIPYNSVMNAVLGAQDYQENFHKMMFTRQSLIDHMENAGLKIIGAKRFSVNKIPRMIITGRKI